MFLFRAIVVDKCCNSLINVIWLCSEVVVPSYIEICPPYRDLVVGHIQKCNFLKYVGVVIKLSCSFYPCNAHRHNVKFLKCWGCTYNPTLH